MDAVNGGRISRCHVVAMPYPGRGHINPLMNLCKSLASRRADILITFVVTEEWLSFIGSEEKPANIRFGSIPNVVPSELVRGADLAGFVEAVSTQMEAPFEWFLDRLEPPPTTIVADTFLPWAVDVGNRRSIPVGSLWTMAASVFWIFYNFDLLVQHRHYPIDLSERGDERVDYIPGLSPTRLADLPTIIHENNKQLLHRALKTMTPLHKAQYLLFTSVDELEAPVINAMKAKFSIPVYSLGPLIPYSKLGDNSSITSYNDHNYLKWLDSQPTGRVLYVSLGSFLPVSSAQMDEIAAGLKESGVRYLWVLRGEASRFGEVCGGNGFVVPWCDQLRVLCHCSIGGFWTHCGWNSTIEGIFAGVPLLTFPIVMDQVPISKLIVEDWKIGQRVSKVGRAENLVKREEIARLVQRFMDLESNEREEMTRRVRELQHICQRAIAKDGSSEINLSAFIRDISQRCTH